VPGQTLDPILRDAVPDDAAAIARMHIDSWRVAYARIVPASALALLSVSQRTESWTHAIRTQPAEQWILVAASDREILGFASGGPSRGDEPAGAAGELYGLYIAPAHWAHGIGTLLMAASLPRLQPQGSELVVLWVLEENERARRFYAARGWVPDGERSPIALLGGAAHPMQVRYRYGGDRCPSC